MTAVIFGTGSHNIDVYFISSVERPDEDKSNLYTVHCRNREGLQEKISFYYDPANNGAIRLKNQKVI